MLVFNPSTAVFIDPTFAAYGPVTATATIEIYATPPSTPPPTIAPTTALAAIVSSSTTFASLSIAALDDPAFDATFRQKFKVQMAAAAGMNTTDIIVHSVAAGSVVVKSTVYFPVNHVCSPETFQQ
eukprot:5643766-Pyramimonas_sp.AAC.1